MEQTLSIYKASAGSGKTFTLAVEYILQLMQPHAEKEFVHTLAVTFTNKATAEMKGRILETLYGLKMGLEGSRPYLEAIMKRMEENGFANTEKQVRQQAGKALTAILHDYSHFRIETIDSFFQSILRGMARELGLAANLQVELSHDEVIEGAVDSLIESMDEKPEVKRWVMDYVREQLDSGDKWDIVGPLKTFAGNIFREEYQRRSEEELKRISDAEVIKAFKNKMQAIKKRAEQDVQKAVDEVMNLIEDFDQISYGKNVRSFLQKVRTMESEGPTKTVESLKFKVKSSPPANEAEVQVAYARLLSLYEDLRREYLSASLALRHLGMLRLLEHIDERAREIEGDSGRFTLSSTPALLSKMVEGSDAPFIFERIGTFINYVMIDEFQDTSRMQWENFKKLLFEKLASGGKGLLVGDIKQSIYRWRNGDWKILFGVEQERELRRFHIKPKPLDTNYRSHQKIVDFNNAFFPKAAELLDAIKPDAEIKLSEIYKDVHQKAKKEDEKGYIRIKLYKEQGARSKEQENTTGSNNPLDSCPLPPAPCPSSLAPCSLPPAPCPSSLAPCPLPPAPCPSSLASCPLPPAPCSLSLAPCSLPPAPYISDMADQIRLLQARGLDLSEIAILVRTNLMAQQLIEDFSQYAPDIQLVSDEAFLLEASTSLQMIVAALRMLIDKDRSDSISEKYLMLHYLRDVLGQRDATIQKVAQQEPNEVLPEAFTEHREELLQLPLYLLAERLWRIFSLERIEGEDVFVLTFFDELQKHLRSAAAPDIQTFLTAWDEKVGKCSVPGASVAGVRILTIHKSKGLEFHTVLLPFSHWQIESDRQGDILWCETDKQPYNELGALPISTYSRDVRSSVFASNYEEEHLERRVDALNTLYVAFTRATANLYVWGKTKPADKIKNISTAAELIYLTLSKEENDKEEESFTFEVGSPLPAPPFGEGSSRKYASEALPQRGSGEGANRLSIDHRMEDAVDVKVVTRNPMLYFLQSNQAQEYLGQINEEQGARSEEQENTGNPDNSPASCPLPPAPTLSQREVGKRMHEVLSRIEDVSQLDEVLLKAREEGIIGEGEEWEAITNRIKEGFRNPLVASWFQAENIVYNECSIASINKEGQPEVLRPDRVVMKGNSITVIDYKFGHPSRHYYDQVKSYMSLMKQMYPEHEVKGYLWYVMGKGTVIVHGS